MKKVVFILAVVLPMVFAGCSKDDEPAKFDYDINLLYGEWRITHVEQKDGSYLDVTTSIAEKVFEPTYAAFNSDGTYSGRGAFGTGSGTYTAVGKTITTVIGGKEYLKYDVLSLSGTNAELKMYETGSSSSIKLKVKKQ